MTLASCYMGLNTRRWHANPALSGTGQTIADHQGRCIMLLLALNPKASAALIEAVALHDLGEAWAGDLAQPFKSAYPAFAAEHAQIEARLLHIGWGRALPYLTTMETAWAKLVDQLDAACWCLMNAPAEYARKASGWGEAELLLISRAKDCGVSSQVHGLLADLKAGVW